MHLLLCCSKVLEKDAILAQFSTITTQLEHALDGVPYTLLYISDEVQEQVCNFLRQFTLQVSKVVCDVGPISWNLCTYV